ncbi:MAG: cobalt-precorrin 5A hydrolase [Oscillospiraceae bacterium]|nr:cobalt-precorrin 5A hydrolase [Oscillospiraceae bacterium]
MKIAVIAVTENGYKIASQIREKLPDTEIFIYQKYAVSGEKSFEKIGELTGRLWNKYDAIVFVSACGIAVRAIAPFVRSKLTDPAVIAADDSGHFAVSLLSGHLGGANDLAEKIGGITGAVPVITTATDNSGRFSPDMFAKANDLAIENMETAKLVAAASLRGEVIGLYSEYPCKNIPERLIGKSGNCGICISSYISKKPFETTLRLIPKNIVIGAGCRKNAAPCDLEAHILHTLSNAGLSVIGLKVLATIDIKKDEPAMKELADKYGLELRTFTASELSSVSGEFDESEFVKNTVGVGNVCERSAAACGAEIIVHKTKGDGVTCAVGVLPFSVDFQRKE